jgi:hypothetical protein
VLGICFPIPDQLQFLQFQSQISAGAIPYNI